MSYKKVPKQKKHISKRAAIVGVVIIILAVVGGIYIRHRMHPTAKHIPTNQGTAVANPNVPGSQNTNNNPATGASASKDQQNNVPGPTPTSGVKPATPTGEFVSDHHPNLSGSPAPNTETSACTTTPGMMCQIDFTKGSVTKKLAAQKTDGDGNTIWNWTLQSVGLTKGSWQVTAVAINGNETATAQDVMVLVVSP